MRIYDIGARAAAAEGCIVSWRIAGTRRQVEH
jgi:hypothetical protein